MYYRQTSKQWLIMSIGSSHLNLAGQDQIQILRCLSYQIFGFIAVSTSKMESIFLLTKVSHTIYMIYALMNRSKRLSIITLCSSPIR
jgi:hypothetical protein